MAEKMNEGTAGTANVTEEVTETVVEDAAPKTETSVEETEAAEGQSVLERAVEGDLVYGALSKIPFVGGPVSDAYRGVCTTVTKVKEGDFDFKPDTAMEWLATAGHAVVDGVSNAGVGYVVGGAVGATGGAVAGFTGGLGVGAIPGAIAGWKAGSAIGAGIGGAVGVVGGAVSGKERGEELNDTALGKTVNQAGEAIAENAQPIMDFIGKNAGILAVGGGLLAGGMLFGGIGGGGGLGLGRVAALAAVAFVGYNALMDTELGKSMKETASRIFGGLSGETEKDGADTKIPIEAEDKDVFKPSVIDVAGTGRTLETASPWPPEFDSRAITMGLNATEKNVVAEQSKQIGETFGSKTAPEVAASDYAL